MPNEIHDRAAITDHISDVMHTVYLSTSIDRLLTQPISAVRMALEVGKRSGRLKAAEVKRVGDALRGIERSDPAAINVINEILRAAIAARKRGDLQKDRV